MDKGGAKEERGTPGPRGVIKPKTKHISCASFEEHSCQN